MQEELIVLLYSHVLHLHLCSITSGGLSCLWNISDCNNSACKKEQLKSYQWLHKFLKKIFFNIRIILNPQYNIPVLSQLFITECLNTYPLLFYFKGHVRISSPVLKFQLPMPVLLQSRLIFSCAGKRRTLPAKSLWKDYSYLNGAR